MRNLTIRRAKTFVASMAAMNVYIEDPMANDLVIHGIPCRKLGKLRNGQEVTFPISDAPAQVFVIADKLSKGFCNEFYPLPAGTEDIVLTGKNHFNPAAGNAFRFDGVTDPAVLANRKKSSTKGLIVMLVTFAICFTLSFAAVFAALFAFDWFFSDPEPKQFAVDDMRITLTDDFIKYPDKSHTAVYTNKKGGQITVMILQEEFSLAEGFDRYTAQDYGRMVIANNDLDTPVFYEDGIVFFEYDGISGNTTYHYVATVFKGPDAFWLIQFGTKQEDAAEFREQIFQWAQSVTFE
ncbi:MAG: hypothetical protein E7438_05145 [Ruminococcaceae bacterium]|nr:hypothetical protein [Oscillospiraceae bacterium]